MNGININRAVEVVRNTAVAGAATAVMAIPSHAEAPTVQQQTVDTGNNVVAIVPGAASAARTPSNVDAGVDTTRAKTHEICAAGMSTPPESQGGMAALLQKCLRISPMPSQVYGKRALRLQTPVGANLKANFLDANGNLVHKANINGKGGVVQGIPMEAAVLEVGTAHSRGVARFNVAPTPVAAAPATPPAPTIASANH